MTRRLRIVVALFLGAVFLMAAHCPQSPMAIYTGSRTAFNNYLGTYLDFRDSLPDGPEKQALRDRFELKFEEAAGALNAWGVAVGTDQEITKQRAFNSLFDNLYFLLRKEGILVSPQPTGGG